MPGAAPLLAKLPTPGAAPLLALLALLAVLPMPGAAPLLAKLAVLALLAVRGRPAGSSLGAHAGNRSACSRRPWCQVHRWPSVGGTPTQSLVGRGHSGSNRGKP